MNDQDAYEVVVTREDTYWLADIPELEGAHTYARTLTGLDRAVREVIVLAADRHDDDMPLLRLDYHYRTGTRPRVSGSPSRPRTAVPRSMSPTSPR